MADPRGLTLYTIPAHRAFADALVAGLMRRFGGDPLGLARGLVLVPNNRARIAVNEAFVRASGGGLVLPRLVAIGADDLGEAIGAALDPADDDAPVPPAIAPLARRMILSRLVQDERPDLDAAEAVRLAGELARTLDQLIVEEVAPSRLAELDLGPELSDHWQRALASFRVVLDRWPGELARLGRIDLAERRARLLTRLATRWREAPPGGFVCAAGVTDSAPAVARLLRSIAGLPHGMVVLANVDLAMPDEEWAALGPHPEDDRRRAIEVHPQYHLKLLLERIGAGRGEVSAWRDGSEHDAPPARARAIANALAPAEFTGKWTGLPAADRRLGGVRAAEFANPAGEAQAIALALRGALETEGRTAALVTPDRALARRVAAHCRRWDIAVDDTAGRPLAILPPGTLLGAIAEAAAQDFAPLPLLT
ncbi:MAG: double-strand break repair protein AddB, partial [Sphingomonadales bacterium]|nr:double-strand break repair protein AddB [Sphingomonadales bacterium]